MRVRDRERNKKNTVYEGIWKRNLQSTNTFRIRNGDLLSSVKITQNGKKINEVTLNLPRVTIADLHLVSRLDFKTSYGTDVNVNIITPPPLNNVFHSFSMLVYFFLCLCTRTSTTHTDTYAHTSDQEIVTAKKGSILV